MPHRFRAFLRRFERHGFVRTGSKMMLTNGTTVLTGVALAVVLARALGPESYGYYVFALTIAQVLSMPVQLGLPTLITREVAIFRAKEEWSLLRGLAAWSVLFVFGALVVVACGFWALLFFQAADRDNDTTSLYFLALPLVAVLTFTQVASAFLRGFEQPFLGSLADGFLRPTLLLILLLGAEALGQISASSAMALHILAAGMALLWSLGVVRRHCRWRPPESTDRALQFRTGAWLKSLWPLSLITGAALINRRLDVFMLGLLRSKEEVAVYSIAMQIAGLALMAQTVVNAIAGPKIARLQASGENAEVQDIVTSACRLSAAGAIAVAAGLFLAGEQVVHLSIGGDFDETVKVGLLIACGYVFSAGMGPVALALNMSGYERFTARIVGASAVLNAVLNFALIPAWGMYGAAVATIGSVLFRQTILAIQMRKQLGLRSGILGLGWGSGADRAPKE